MLLCIMTTDKFTKVIGKTTKKMDKESTFGRMETSTKETIAKEKDMATVSCIIIMDRNTKDSG